MTRAKAKVIEKRTQAITRYRHTLYLECGHIAFRTGPKTPQRVWCIACNSDRDDLYSPWRWYSRWKD